MADLRPYLIQWALDEATRPRKGTKTTSVKAARELCALAADYLESGEPMPEPLRQRLAAALRAAADGDDANRALGLKRGAGVRIDPRDQRAREWFVFQRYEMAIEAGRSPAGAKEQCAEEFKLDTRRIEQIIASWTDVEK